MRLPLMNYAARAVVAPIRIYQRLVSPFLGPRCRFHPSCSEYGILAYRKYGFFKATMMTWSRYRDCHPFSDRPYIDYP